MNVGHIRLVCWAYKHVQVVSEEFLRSVIIAPICTQRVTGGDICGSDIWAVKHDDEPTRYVGRPPHTNWAAWADCIPASAPKATVDD